MVEGNGTSTPIQRGLAAGSLADLLDRVVWDYSPRDGEASPLVSTARFFEDFPWDGEPERDARPPDPGEAKS